MSVSEKAVLLFTALIVASVAAFLLVSDGSPDDPDDGSGPDIHGVPVTETFRHETADGAYVEGRIVLYENDLGLSGFLILDLHYDEVHPTWYNELLLIRIPGEFGVTDIMTDYGPIWSDDIWGTLPGVDFSTVAKITGYTQVIIGRDDDSRVPGDYTVMISMEPSGLVYGDRDRLVFTVKLESGDPLDVVVELPDYS